MEEGKHTAHFDDIVVHQNDDVIAFIEEIELDLHVQLAVAMSDF